jgi:hypothetical protein
MADGTVTNGRLPDVDEMTREQAKALHAQLNKFYRKEKGDKRKNKPPLRPIGEVVKKPGNFTVQKVQTDWDSLPNWAPFVTDLECTDVSIKVSREKAASLTLMKPYPVASGLVHRVFLGM